MSSISYISEKADALIKKYDTRDPLALCRELRIRVRYKDLGTAVKAYYFYQSRIKNIVLNSRSGSIVQRVLCAHELGHAVLHGKLAAMRGFRELELFDRTVPAEYEANLFAAELLVSDEELLRLLNDRDKTFFGISRELYIPAELLDFKFRILKHKGYHLEAPCLAPSDFLKGELPGSFQENG